VPYAHHHILVSEEHILVNRIIHILVNRIIHILVSEEHILVRPAMAYGRCC